MRYGAALNSELVERTLVVVHMAGGVLRAKLTFTAFTLVNQDEPLVERVRAPLGDWRCLRAVFAGRLDSMAAGSVAVVAERLARTFIGP